MAEVKGWTAGFFYKVGGIAAGGSWVLATNIVDLTGTNTATEIPASTRASNGYTQTEPGQLNADATFDVIHDTADPFYQALEAAFLARSVIGVRVLDGTAAGSKGLQADMKVFSLTSNEPLDGLVTKSVVLKPCRSSTAPSQVTI